MSWLARWAYWIDQQDQYLIWHFALIAYSTLGSFTLILAMARVVQNLSRREVSESSWYHQCWRLGFPRLFWTSALLTVPLAFFGTLTTAEELISPALFVSLLLFTIVLDALILGPVGAFVATFLLALCRSEKVALGLVRVLFVLAALASGISIAAIAHQVWTYTS